MANDAGFAEIILKLHERRPVSTWLMLRAYYEMCGDVRRWIPLNALLFVFDAVIATAVPITMGYIIDQLTTDAPGFIAHRLPWLLPAILGGSVIFYLNCFGQRYLTQMISQRVGARCQTALYEHLQQLSADFYQRTPVGEVTARLTTDVMQGVIPFYEVAMDLFWALAVMVVSCIGMAYLGWPLLVAYLCLAVLFGGISHLMGMRVQGLNRAARDESGRIAARLTEQTAAHTLIRAFAQETASAHAVRTHVDLYLGKMLRTLRLATVFSEIGNAFLCVAPLGLLLGGAYFVGPGLTIGALVAAYAYWVRSTGPVWVLLNKTTTIFSCFSSMERIFEFFHEQPLVADRVDAQPLVVERGEITLRDVRFHYPNNNGAPAVDGLSVTVPAHTSLAIVGETGAGKSTIIQLLLRFYDPDSGQVLVDGQDLREITQDSLRRQIGVVTQETLLLSGSVRDNLLFAKPDATQQDLITAIEHAEAWDFVQQLPEGLDTLLGERGVRLSGGEKQRLAIARVFLKNPPILLFDEATSALDAITERQIQQTTARLFAGRTVIIIAHRLSTVTHCDQILLLDSGHLAAIGTHATLLATTPSYREMCEKLSVGV